MTGRPADPLAVLRRLDVEATRRGHVSPDFPDALAAVERLVEAARPVTEHHFDTCDLVLGLSPAYPCSCGVDALRAALALFDGGEA